MWLNFSPEGIGELVNTFGIFTKQPVIVDAMKLRDRDVDGLEAAGLPGKLAHQLCIVITPGLASDGLNFLLDRAKNPERLTSGQSCFGQLSKKCSAPVEVFFALNQVKIQLVNKNQDAFVAAFFGDFDQLLDLFRNRGAILDELNVLRAATACSMMVF